MQFTPSHWQRAALAVVTALALVLAPLAIGTAHADDVEAARAHYARGQKLYEAGDYRGAIAEFTKANVLAPSPLLEFNIGLAYDRLGEKQEALRRYRAYLAQMPDAPNRAAVEAKINRLESELAEEARVAEEARAAEEARKAEEARAAEEARKAEEAKKKPAEPPPPAPEPEPEPEPVVAEPEPEPVALPPERTAPAPTGDPAMDRVNGIDVRAIRDARLGGADRASLDPGGPPPDRAQPPPPADPAPAPPSKKADKPAYKQWWFWVVVGVSAIILIDIASDDGGSNNAMPLEQRNLGGNAAGPVLFTF